MGAEAGGAPAGTPATTTETPRAKPDEAARRANGASKASAPPAGSDGTMGEPGGTSGKPGVESELETKPPEPKRYRLKTVEDGQEREEEYDEATLRRWIQKGRTADKRFDEAARLAKDAKRIVDGARSETSRMEALAELLGGPDAVVAFAEQVLSDKLLDAQRTPEEREAAAMKAELERLRAEKTQSEEKAKKDALEAEQRAVEKRLDATVVRLAEVAGLPKGAPWALRLVTDVLEPYIRHGIPATQEDLVAEVKEAMRERGKTRDAELISGLEGQALLDYLGPQNVKRILAATVSAHQAQRAKPATAPPAKTKVEDIDLDGKDRYIQPWEFEARERERARKRRTE